MSDIYISDQVIKPFADIFNIKKYKHVIWDSGRAGAKSSGASIKAVWTIINEEPKSVYVIRKRNNKLRRTVFNEVLRAINRLRIPIEYFRITRNPMQITFNKTGNSIYFAGVDGADATKGLIDPDRPIGLVIVDEVTEFFEHGFDGDADLQNVIATFVRGNDQDFTAYYLFNPPKNPHAKIFDWVKKMERRDDCYHLHTTYKDVPEKWLGKELLKEAELLKEIDYRMYRWIWRGEAVGLDDAIYYMFDDHKHIADVKEEPDFIIIGVDYGQMNATAFEAFGICARKHKMFGIDEYYHSGRDTGHQKSPSLYAKDMRKFVDGLTKRYGKKAYYLVIDPSASGLIEEIKKECPECVIKKAENNVSLGISRVQTLLNYDRLTLSKSQKMLKEEIHLYSYDPKSIERGEEKPLKEFDHAIDATRYSCNLAWKWCGVKGVEWK